MRRLIQKLAFESSLVRTIARRSTLLRSWTANFHTPRESVTTHEEGNSVKISLANMTVLFSSDSSSDRKQAKTIREARYYRCLLDQIQSGDIVWDIGANIGFYTVSIGSLGMAKQVVCFEPGPHAHARLLANIAENELDDVAIPEPLALSDKCGKSEFRTASETSTVGQLTTASDVDTASAGATTNVIVSTIDEYVRQHPSRFPSLLKIDVEGFEVEVLRGGSETLSDVRCREVFCEIHSRELERRGLRNGSKMVTAMLGDYGFGKVAWIDSSHVHATR